MTAPISQFKDVTVVAKANVYFEGNVVSHTVLMPGGAKKTLGIIRKGSYHFGTDAPEIMEIVDGTCKVTIDGRSDARAYGPGAQFEVPGKSGFQIEVADGLCQYICSFIS
jgi:purine/pyrimidine-nucleoside phosphorylase